MPDLERKKILILGGTAEASELAESIGETMNDRAEPILSLAGVLEPARRHTCRLRTGGFGGIDAMAEYLQKERISLVVDATHPFAERISSNAYCACARAEVQRLSLIRPSWKKEPGDHWLDVESVEEAASILPGIARRVMLAIGRRRLDAFSGLSDIFFLVRLLGPEGGSLPLADYHIDTSRPPRDRESERRLLEEFAIDTMVLRESGSREATPKLEAARDLGIKVLLISRPPPEPGPVASSVEEAMEYVKGQL